MFPLTQTNLVLIKLHVYKLLILQKLKVERNSYFLEMSKWTFALFSEDSVQTSHTLTSAQKNISESIDVGAFSPPEFHTSCILESSPTKIRIWTVGGHYQENPIFNTKSNMVVTKYFK